MPEFDFSKIKAFQWDKWNIDKSYEKHGITPNESEEIFLDEDLKVVRDVKHSQKEDRFIAVGKASEGKILLVVFTIRKDQVRIISARKAKFNERRKYESKIKENTSI